MSFIEERELPTDVDTLQGMVPAHSTELSGIRPLASCLTGTGKHARRLVDALARLVLGGDRVHGDEAAVPMLERGLDSTRTARWWSDARDDCRPPVWLLTHCLACK